jgi:hypothetical protein
LVNVIKPEATRVNDWLQSQGEPWPAKRESGDLVRQGHVAQRHDVDFDGDVALNYARYRACSSNLGTHREPRYRLGDFLQVILPLQHQIHLLTKNLIVLRVPDR